MSVTEGTTAAERENRSLRLFAGLDLPPEVSDALRQLLDRLRPAATLRWTPVENLHITTKFIGAWPEPRLPELKSAMDVIPKSGGIDIAVRGLGWHPNPHQPHVFWAGVHAGNALADLHRSTDDAAATLGVPKETKPYSPHLTLARVPRGPIDLGPVRRAVASLDSVDFGTFRAERFFLFLSEARAGGSVYSKLAAFPL